MLRVNKIRLIFIKNSKSLYYIKYTDMINHNILGLINDGKLKIK